MSIPLPIFIVFILFVAQFSYGKEELTKDEFFLKSELTKLAFGCSELNSIVKKQPRGQKASCDRYGSWV